MAANYVPKIYREKKTILIVGSGGVGKTSFINRVSNKPFDRRYNPTIGTNKSAPIIFNQYELNILDSSGQEFWNEIPKYDGIDGAIVMFDIHSSLSYRAIPDYIRNIRETQGQIPIVICGNKLDVTTTIRKIPKNDRVYLEISSKSSINYDKIFEKLFK